MKTSIHSISADLIHSDLNLVWEHLHQTCIARSNPVLTRPAGRQESVAAPLDPAQAAAAGHVLGPIRVLAPAGSGKTRTLTARIASLIQRGAPPARILALAFNTKAAVEMGARLQARSITGVQVRTFHSLGYEIVREAYHWKYKKENEAAHFRLFRRTVARHCPLHPEADETDLADFLKALRLVELSLVPPGSLEPLIGFDPCPFKPVFKDLLTARQRAGLLTFTGMIYYALRALVEKVPLRKKWQDRFDFILVDEFQDLNPSQMMLVRILALPHSNLFVVGDDDQTIYSWRGANASYILQFEQLFPNTASVVLTTNYRSSSRIVRHARWLIEHNATRIHKQIQPSRGASDGSLDIMLRESLGAQADAAAAWALTIKKQEKADWSDFAVLFRENALEAPAAAALQARGIPFNTSRTAPYPEDLPPDKTKGAVSLMTIHKAKGKEFPFVVYLDLGGLPVWEDVLEEERRVAYVGLTRAQRGLLITANSGEPPRFLSEIALNPAFADYAAAYLARRRRQVQRQLFKIQHGDGLAAWLKSWFVNLDAASFSPHPLLNNLEELETELYFRQILGRKDDYPAGSS